MDNHNPERVAMCFFSGEITLREALNYEVRDW